MAKSVRYSWANDQKPLSVKMGTLVAIKATNISISNGITASRVSNPSKSKMPQLISKTPTKDAQNAGLLKPIWAKRPAPVACGVMNFCRPSERKIKPTIRRMSIVGISAVLITLFKLLC